MGSPLSSLMADVFMDRLENDIFDSSNPLTSHVRYWYRYVDNVLCLWTRTADLVQNFLSFINSLYPTINSLYPTIKFTLEFGGSTINFPDLTITILNHNVTSSKFSEDLPTLTSSSMLRISITPLTKLHPSCI